MKYTLMLISILLITLNLQADAGCEGVELTHSSFCQTKDEATCNVHSAVCIWKINKQNVSFELSQGKSCKPKRGEEVHADFCAEMGAGDCGVSEATCEWR